MRKNLGRQNLPGRSKEFATTDLCTLWNPQYGKLPFNYIIAGAGGIGQDGPPPCNSIHTTINCITHFIWATFWYDIYLCSRQFMLTGRRNAGYAHRLSRHKNQISNPRGFQVSNLVYNLKMRCQKFCRYIPYGELSEVCIQVLSDCR